MASLTTNNNAMEMQYKPAEPMQASPSTAAQEVRIANGPSKPTAIITYMWVPSYPLVCH